MLCNWVGNIFLSLSHLRIHYANVYKINVRENYRVGGTLPLAFTYLAECCPRLSRSRWVGLLVAAGALGGVYAALLAWVVVPTTGEMVVLENKEHFSAWHRFLLLCSLPALCSTVGLIFLPESPRYLVEVGRDVEAMMVYQVFPLTVATF